MNTTGKTLTALILLVSILGVGWWAVQKRALLPGLPSLMSTPDATVAPDASADTARQDGLRLKDGSPDLLLVAEIEASVQWVSEVLAATGNISSAVSMLNVLERRIARLDPQGKTAALKRAIVADRESLQAAMADSPVAVAAKIDQLVLEIDRLPLVSSAPPAGKPAKLATPSANPSATPGNQSTAVTQGNTNQGNTNQGNTNGSAAQSQPQSQPQPQPEPQSLWAAFWSDMKSRLFDVVQIRKVDNPDAFFMTPEQAALVAERLRLRLLSARTALLTRQEALFTQDMLVAEKILNQVFDAAAPEVIATKAALLSIKSAGLAFKTPALTQTTAELSRLKPAAGVPATKATTS
jgi:uncharacterized protein HemX